MKQPVRKRHVISPPPHDRWLLKGFPWRGQKPAFEKVEWVKLYQVTQEGGYSLAGHQLRQERHVLFSLHSLVGDFSQDPDQSHLLRNSLGSQMGRKKCCGLKEPMQYAGEREDRLASVTWSP